MTDSAGSNEPEAESLKPQSDKAAAVKDTPVKPDEAKASHKPIPESEQKHHRSAYRPSHRATFIGLAVVILILAINAVVLAFLLKGESSKNKVLNDKGVSISPQTLSKLGVNDAQIGSANETLVVDPSAEFNSGVTVAGGVNIGGQLHLNSTFSADSANLAQLQAGNTSLNALTVNGNTTAGNMSVKGNFGVSGISVFQNTVTVGQILTVDNSAAVANNLSVGGELTANTIATTNLILSGTMVLGSHIQTSGSSPSVGPGTALGSNGTVGISGDDAAGTISVNIGINAQAGILAYVAFHKEYSSIPRIVVSPVGVGANFYIVSPTTSGFEVAVTSGLPYGGYALDYIVEQ